MIEKIYRIYWYPKDSRLLVLFHLMDQYGQRRSLTGYFDDIKAARDFLGFLGLCKDMEIKEMV
jgi:hypothetical protein